MQMIDVLKRLAELDAKNSNVVSEINQRTAMNAYDQMSAGGNDAKGRTGMAGDQSDRLKARMDKRWGSNSTTIELVPGKFYVVTGGRFRGSENAVAGPFADDLEAETEKADYSQGGREDAAVAQWTGKDWNFNFSEGVSESLEECGMPGMGSMSQPHTPASINMTAASGDELSAMLRDIMTLAGHSGEEHEHDMAMPGTDGVAVATMEPEMDPTASMRSMIDKLNPSGDEEDDEEDDKETDEGAHGRIPGVSTSAGDPNAYPAADADEYAHHENQPGSGETSNGEKRQSNLPTATYESLMAEYQKFIAEGKECKVCHKPMKKCECDDE